MSIFKRPRLKPAAVSTQIRSAATHPFGMLDNYVPLGGGDIRLYRAIREAVPVLDSAVMKIIRLTGGFSVACDDRRTEKELNEFLRRVNVGRSQRGIGAFLDNYLDSLLTCGRAVGEIVTNGNREIAAVLCGNVCDVQVKEGAVSSGFRYLWARRLGIVRAAAFSKSYHVHTV